MIRALLLALLALALAAPLSAQEAERRGATGEGDVELSPEGVPAGEPETLPADEKSDARAGEPSTRAARFRARRRRGKALAPAATKPARGAAARGLRGPEAALEAPEGSGPGIYQEPGTEVTIRGDTTNPLGGDIAEIVGHVRLERKGMVLSSDKIRLDRRKGEVLATGNVVVADPSYTLSAGRMVFYTNQEMAVSWESPKILEVRRSADGEIQERTEMTAFQITVFTSEKRVEGLERVRIYRMVRRGGKLELDFKITADSCDSNLINHQNVFKGQVKVESPSYTVEAKRLIFDQGSDRFTCIGDARVTGFDAKGEVSSRVAGNKVIYLIRDHRAIVMGGVTASLKPGQGSGVRILDAAAVKDATPSEELLSLPDPPKDFEKDRFRRRK